MSREGNTESLNKYFIAIIRKDFETAQKCAKKLPEIYKSHAINAASIIKEYKNLRNQYQKLKQYFDKLTKDYYDLLKIDKSDDAAIIVDTFVLLSNGHYKEADIRSKSIKSVNLNDVVKFVWSYVHLQKSMKGLVDNGFFEDIPQEIEQENLKQLIFYLFEGKFSQNSKDNKNQTPKFSKIQTTQILEQNEFENYQQEKNPRNTFIEHQYYAEGFQKNNTQEKQQKIRDLKAQNEQLLKIQRQMKEKLEKQSRKINSNIAPSSILKEKMSQVFDSKDNFKMMKQQMQDCVELLQGEKLSLNELVKSLQIQLNEVRNIKQQIQNDNANFSKSLENANSKVNKLEQQLSEEKERNQKLRSKVSSLEEVINLSRNRSQLLDFFQPNHTKNIEKEFPHLKEQIQKIETENLKLIEKNVEIHDQLQKKDQQNKKLQLAIHDLKKQLALKDQQLEEQKSSFNSQMREKEEEISSLQKRLESLLNTEPKRQKVTSHLFTSGDLFDGYEFERQELISKLEDHLYPIKRTRLVYRFDPLNRVNFHKYIDDHTHIVLVVKTIYGRVFAGYSAECFNSKGTKKGDALLLALWNQKVYQVKKTGKGVTYDDYFLIFGNSEVRIKFLETKVFSNFGINNGYFESRGDKVVDFLGEAEREVELLTYEIYTLEFER